MSAVPGGVGDPGRGESVGAEQAAVAVPARDALGSGVVAADRRRVVDAELGASTDDLRLREVDQRCVDRESSTFDRGAGREVGGRLEGLDELGTAIGVAAVVERVDADEHIARAPHLGDGQRRTRGRSCCVPARR